MFTEYMSFEEIRKELDRDKVHLFRKINSHALHVKKLMRKTKATHLDKYYDWVSPRKNRWTYHLMADLNVGKENFKVSHYCLFFTERSYVVILHTIDKDRVYYYTSHFFTRYFQREHLEREDLHEVIRTFVETNNQNIRHPLQQESESKFDVFMQYKTGAAFGSWYEKINLLHVRTFVTNDMLKGDQVELAKTLDEQFHIGIEWKKKDKTKPSE